MKLYYFLFETGPSAQSAIPTLGDDRRRVSRTGAAAEEHGYLDIVDTMDLDLNDPEDESLVSYFSEDTI